MFRDPVRGPTQDLGQMDSGVRIVVYTQEQHLPIKLVHSPHGTLWDVWRKRKRVPENSLRRRTSRGKGIRMVAPTHVRQTPERGRDRTEATRCLRIHRIERGVSVQPRRHDESTLGAERVSEGVDEAARSTFNRTDGSEGGVHEQHGSGFHPEVSQLLSDPGTWSRSDIRHDVHHQRRSAFATQ